MRSGVGNLRDIARAALLGVILILLAIIGLVLFASIWGDVIFRIIIGFYFFLKGNLSSLTTNSDIWIPGIIAFLLSVLCIHYLGRSWCRKKDRTWHISNSICLGLCIPTLFIIAFVVPGAFLQVSLLSDTKMTVRSGVRPSAIAKMDARNLAQVIFGDVNMRQLHRFPDSLQPFMWEYMHPSSFYANYQRRDEPEEPFIYLGAGLAPDQDPEVPLIISPPYISDGKKMRIIYTTSTMSGSQFEIPDSELDQWIEKSLEARRKMQAAKPQEPDQNP